MLFTCIHNIRVENICATYNVCVYTYDKSATDGTYYNIEKKVHSSDVVLHYVLYSKI